MSDLNSLVTTNFLNIKIGEVGNKIPDVCGLVMKSDSNVKISDIEKNVLRLLVIITL